VIHGRADRLVKTEAALALGRGIPDAEVHIYPGMGHQVIPELWDEFMPVILRTIARAGTLSRWPIRKGTGPRIYFEMQDVPGGEPLVLIEGMGAQMIGWRQGFVDLLKGQRLQRHPHGQSRCRPVREAWELASDQAACYSIRDMAEDVCRVLDSLGLESAHIVGQSMGGIMAQAMTIHWPEFGCGRSTVLHRAGLRRSALVQPELLKQLRAGLFPNCPSGSRAGCLTRLFMPGLLACGSAPPIRPTRPGCASMLGQFYDRGFRAPRGGAASLRQSAGGFDFRPMLGGITAPTAIIHGRADHAIKTEAAFELAAAHPGCGAARLSPAWATRSPKRSGRNFTIIAATAQARENRSHIEPVDVIR
jgi:pimeloyl-ACP methyl ester carboxylesterase